MEKLPEEQRYTDDAVGKKLISADPPYSFDLISKTLVRHGKIVKNCWIGPDQNEVDSAINSIEAAVEILKAKNK